MFDRRSFLLQSLLWLLLLLASIAPSSTGAFRYYDGFQLFRAIPTTPQQLVALRNFTQLVQSKSADGIDVWNFRPNLHESTELFVGPSNVQSVLDFLDNNRIKSDLLIEDFGVQLRESLAQVESHDATMETINSVAEFDLGHYHPYESIAKYLRLLADAHPESVRLRSIGKTTEGRDIPFVTLGYPAFIRKPAVFIDAGIHAREWIAPAVALHFINALINGDADFHSLLKDIDIHVLPVLNPDGYAYTWTKDRLWRRTRSGPKQVNQKNCGTADYEDNDVCYGVDPNRNFPFHWAEAGISKCPCSQVYSGEAPLSEPECANLASFLSKNNATIKAYLSMHSYSNLLIHPFGFKEEKYPQNVEELRRMANAMAKAIVDAGGDKFKIGSAPDVLYLVSGSSDDFAYSLGIKYTFTMELTSGWYGSKYVGFVYPEEGINTEAAQVLPALRVLAEQVRKEARGWE